MLMSTVLRPPADGHDTEGSSCFSDISGAIFLLSSQNLPGRQKKNAMKYLLPPSQMKSSRGSWPEMHHPPSKLLVGQEIAQS